MLLAVDAGNTSVAFGVFNNNNLVASFKLSTNINRSVDEYGMLILEALKVNGFEQGLGEIKEAVLSSVVIKVTNPLKRALEKYIEVKPLMVDDSLNLGISLKCDNPKEVGSDRIASAVAAFNTYKSAVLIVDVGTATTIGVVNSKGEFIGGAICPGINLCLEALAQKTSKLPKISIEKPSGFIGANTKDNILSGVFWGHIGQIEYIIKGIKSQMQEDLVVVLTGGLSNVICDFVKEVDFVKETLTIEGLQIISELNNENKK